MKNSKLNVGFIGAGDWGSVFLKHLFLSDKVNILNILTIASDNNSLPNDHYKDLMVYYNSVDSYNSFINKPLDFIVMSGWMYKIPMFFIEQSNFSIFNIHASLLPKYRGPEPLIQQILNNETEGGITIHKVNQYWDKGEICVQEKFIISKDDNNQTLFFKAARTGKKVLNIFLENYLNNNVDYVKQDESISSYYKKLNTKEYLLNKSSSIEDVWKLSRAFFGAYPLIYNANEKFIVINKFDICLEKDPPSYCLPLRNGFIKLLNYKEVSNLHFSKFSEN